MRTAINKLQLHLIKFGPYWAILVLSIVHLLINWNRYFTLYDWADVDDTMQYDLSRNLSEGEWLGPYSRATLIKGVVFPAWTATLHLLHIPLWLGTSIILLVASLSLIYALRRLISNKWLLVTIYALVVLNPMLTERAYRDYLLPAILLFVCAWSIGLFITVLKARENRKVTTRDATIFTIIGIISLPAWYYTREDGYWILPLIGGLCATTLIMYLTSIHWKVFRHKASLAKILIALVLPFTTVWLTGLGIASLNERHYGRYVINDYFSSDFVDAYSSLTRVNSSDKPLTVPVSQEMREALYKVSPAFNALKPCLDAEGEPGACEGFKRNGVDAPRINDYQGGWFPFALRLAVDRQGHYATASSAEKYYTELANQVNAACDTGKISCHDAHIVSLLPSPDIKIIEALITSPSSSIWSMISYLQSLKKDNDILQNQTPSLDEMSHYYGVRYMRPAEYGAIGKAREALADSILVLYRLLSPILMYGSIIVTVVATFLYFRRKTIIDWRILIIAWLLIATIGIRLAMLAYVYTVHFPTTTNIYFAPVYVLLFLLEGISIYLLVSLLRNRRIKRKDA